MQATELPDQFMARPQKEVVGVPQDDPRPQFLGQIPLQHAFHGRLRADRHENRGLHDPVGRVQTPGTCPGLGTNGFKFKTDRAQGVN